MSIKILHGVSTLSFLAVWALSVPAHGQSFSVNTSVSQADTLYSYAFTLNYDQAGQVQNLTDNIWDWSFDISPGTPGPAGISTPTGWTYSYDQPTGQFDFYTEGPNGFGNGDFGSYVILPGQSLSGFGLTTPAAPGLSVAFATDVQFNQDIATAILPTSVPVPETSTSVSFGVLLLLTCGAGIAAWRNACRLV